MPKFTMEANTMKPDQTAPIGSSLIWVHIVCNEGDKSTYTKEDKRANSNCCEGLTLV